MARRIVGSRPFRAFAAAGLIALALAPTAASADVAVSSFGVSGQGALMHFYFQVPQAFIPFYVKGGGFESYGALEGTPHAFGYAGAFPVPLATSLGIIIPEKMPGTDTPIPENVREGFRSVDYSALPNYCQADFPPSKDGSDESYCGGPAQPEKAYGATGAALNGHVKATGSFEDVGKTSILSESRVGELSFVGLQSKLFGGSTQFRAYVNDLGVPVAQAYSRIGALNILGSLVKIDNLESTAQVINDGTEKGSAAAVSLTIAGATVIGIPVQITGSGVTVAQPVQGMSPQQAADAVSKALSEAHIASIRIIPGSGVHREGHRLIAESPSLEVEYDSQTPTPAHIIEQYGVSTVNLSAVPSAPQVPSVAPADSGEASAGAASPQQDTAPDRLAASAGSIPDGESLTAPESEEPAASNISAAEPSLDSGGGLMISTPGSPTIAVGASDRDSESAEVSFGPAPRVGTRARGSIGNRALLASQLRPFFESSPYVRNAYVGIFGLLGLAVLGKAVFGRTQLFHKKNV